MNVIVIGAGGIVGQYMRLYQPKDVDALYTRRSRSWYFYDQLRLGEDQDIKADLRGLAERFVKNPGSIDVIVNLAGENRPDIVEQDPARWEWVNTKLPTLLGEFCDKYDTHLVHVSTQGVYQGNDAPYPATPPGMTIGTPVNAYGRQKLQAERYLADRCKNWTIARLTFVVGTRPLPIGRPNPFEQMYEQLCGTQDLKQVNDRRFSPCFAKDAAAVLWDLVKRGNARPAIPMVFNVGTPVGVSRYEMAQMMDVWGGSSAPTPTVVPVKHSDFPTLAERPLDTTYALGSLFLTPKEGGIGKAMAETIDEHTKIKTDRAVELALFFGCGRTYAEERLAMGFHANHAAVAGDWRASDPKTDAEILEWYRTTHAYCWELSAYHQDVRFNYAGMCTGIAEHLKNVQAPRVLALGDGIGDLSLILASRGLQPVYHDLLNSVTQQFAFFRFTRMSARVGSLVTVDWRPPQLDEHDQDFDAVVALDFFEHLPNVEEWARATFDLLRSGGWFLAQNAFGIGDMEHEGSIPMHLTVNNKYTTEWAPLLARIGFVDQGNGWWRKP